MDVYIYQEKTRKVKGEEMPFLEPVGVIEGYDDVDEALSALLEADDAWLGVELVIFTQEPEYITPEEPQTRFTFARRNGNAAVVEEEPEAEEEYDEEEVEAEEEEAPAPAPKRSAKRKPPARSSKPAAKRSAKPKPAASGARKPRAGQRVGGGKRSPFTRNAKSDD